MERDHCRQAFDGEFGQCAAGAGEGFLAGGSGDDEFGEHRIELATDHRAGFDTGVDADTGAGGGGEGGDRSGCG